MKNHLILFISFLFLFISSCKDDEEKLACPMILLPMTVNVTYVDENGEDLLFGDNPTYSTTDIDIYLVENEEQISLKFTVNEGSRFITIDVPQAKDGTFLIELEPNEADEITYRAEVNEDDYCKNLMVTKLKQNDNEVFYNVKRQVWELVK